ncbi:hypothetical protein J6590_006228 [Homalodisca vitripennis]|nr:hypothetical protein J6590_006228 [Homalodisca vitripennis]
MKNVQSYLAGYTEKSPSFSLLTAQSGMLSAPTRLAYPGGKIPLKEAKANDIKKALQCQELTCAPRASESTTLPETGCFQSPKIYDYVVQ